MRILLLVSILVLATVSDGFAQRVRRAEPARPEQQGPPSSQGGATLRAGDTFEMNLSGMPIEDSQFARSYTIGNDGTVNIPYAGQIRAAGLSQTQLERAIERRYIDEKIFRWPTVTINTQHGSRYVTVGGSVRAPQRMVWAPDLTLTSALNAAGGGGDFSGDKVDLIRGGQRQTFSIKRLRSAPSDDPRLLPGDQLELR